jgi:hypothetical protein
MYWCLPCALAVSGRFKQGGTDKTLILLDKSSSVSLFHRFQGEAAGNFQIGGPIPIKISRAVFAKIVKQRNRRRFHYIYQWLVRFILFETA